MRYEIEKIADYACACGENPLWHPRERRFYWIDIPTGKLFRHDPAAGNHEMVFQQDVIGGFTIQKDGALLLFMRRGRVAIWREGRELETIIDHIPEVGDGRFNDVAADPEGRVFCGVTMKDFKNGALYRLDPDGFHHRLLENIGCSNGIGFSPDLKTMYHTDSTTRTIHAYHYERSTGAISNGRVLVEVPPSQGLPDGLTVDADGNIWSARWDGRRVVKHAPDGSVLDHVELPVKKVSSVTFGGEDCRDMYLTTAGGDKKDSDGPDAGAVFRVRGPFQGVPEFKSEVRR